MERKENCSWYVSGTWELSVDGWMNEWELKGKVLSLEKSKKGEENIVAVKSKDKDGIREILSAASHQSLCSHKTVVLKAWSQDRHHQHYVEAC